MADGEDADDALLRKCTEELGEHFDSVQVFVTRHDPVVEGGTASWSRGVGNWFARLGQVREWLIKLDERGRQSERVLDSDE